MSYSVFISYSMSDSSWAYDLSAQLGRKRIMCYLDCSISCKLHSRTWMEQRKKLKNSGMEKNYNQYQQ